MFYIETDKIYMHDTENRRKQRSVWWGIILIVVTALVGGAVPAIGKIALRDIPPFGFTFIRFFFAALALIPFYLQVRNPIRKNLLKILGVSLFGVGNVIFFAFGVHRTGAGMTQAIYTVTPLLAAVASYFLVRERFTNRKVSGLLVGFVGAALLVILPLVDSRLGSEVTLVGNLMILIAAVSVMLFTVLSKRLQDRYHPIEITFFFSVLALVVSLPFSILEMRDVGSGWIRGLTLPSLLGIFYIGAVGTALYYLLTQYIIRNATPVIASMVLYVQPFAGLFWAYIFLGERITWLFAIGVALAILGIWLAMNPGRTNNSK